MPGPTEISEWNRPKPAQLVYTCKDCRLVGIASTIEVARFHSLQPDQIQTSGLYGPDLTLSRDRPAQQYVLSEIDFAQGMWRDSIEGVVFVGHETCGANPGPATMHWDQLRKIEEYFGPKLADRGLTCRTMLLQLTEDPHQFASIQMNAVWAAMTGNLVRDSTYGWVANWGRLSPDAGPGPVRAAIPAM